MKILEINLISAQGLNPPSSSRRRMQTYAVVSIDSSTKLRSRIDLDGGEDPIWGDKFLFKVTPEFLSGETTSVSVEIFAVGCLRDKLLGTVRLLISNIPLFSQEMRTPSFVAMQIRRPSGRFQGLLNIGAIIHDASDFASLDGVSAICYRDLVGQSICSRRRRDLKKSSSTGKDDRGENILVEIRKICQMVLIPRLLHRRS
ncbi:hypothetical protein JCGZ_17048 [Jatropha curcas]|uniref:C2 domain-containing protein n=1 Tax=Jatropha curcas TaxID=180498 RepID=A0A067K242_JATCU|nr:uncharacterized protein LOC105641309 isoform X1 [Jatropha curcas]XP_037491615.1 uncharacterized protein LOC105641309 isoform X2 [Jatropha curcas]KDP30266.1 hypothetical protein JCGZ_17048 [Jatropha curcas]